MLCAHDFLWASVALLFWWENADSYDPLLSAGICMHGCASVCMSVLGPGPFPTLHLWLLTPSPEFIPNSQPWLLVTRPEFSM